MNDEQHEKEKRKEEREFWPRLHERESEGRGVSAVSTSSYCVMNVIELSIADWFRDDPIRLEGFPTSGTDTPQARLTRHQRALFFA